MIKLYYTHMDWRDCTIRMALKLGPAVLIILSFVSILLGIIFHAISVDELKYRTPAAQSFEPGVIIGDSPKDLVWFLQVTDLHLSIRGNFDRIKSFTEFARTYVDIIKPDVVLVTGDITDGIKPNSTFNTGPQLEEWVAYSDAVTQSNALNKTVWLDLRGNHDNFNVYRPRDPKTLFRQYSVQGKHYERNYMYTLSKEGKNYTFIGVDEVQTPGLKIPFNFIGLVNDEDLTELQQFKATSKKFNSQYTIWFAHYPTSSIASPGGGLRSIINGPYLCGHFHTIGNWVTKMHAAQQPGYAEVELGDWKHNRRLRLAAIDHQLFSLVDVGFKQFPIALMTNPKTAEHSMPKYEPVERIINSTHIRVIAFSNVSLTSVEISIDGKAREPMTNSGGPLFVLPWNPKDYAEGLHKANIYVTDSEGKNSTYSQAFSMDHSKEESSIGARILLRVEFRTGVMAIFFFIVVLCTLPYLILRLVAYKHEETGLKRHYRGTFLYSLHLLSNIDRICWPLFVIPVWMAVGPHFVGRLVDDAIGVCFVWGVLIDGTFIYTGITYNVASIFLLLVHIPSVILLTHQVSDTYNKSITANQKSSIVNLKLILQFAITALQCAMGSLLFNAYGTMSYFTSFPYLWCILVYYYCWFQCTTIERADFLRFATENREEQQALTVQRSRDDKSSTSNHST